MGDDRIADSQIRAYGEQFERFGDSPQAAYHSDARCQEMRFERLVAPLLPFGDDFSLHDVGAGLCDLHAWLNAQGIRHRYSATEIVPDVAEHARRKFPGIEVDTEDFTRDARARKADWVVMCGALNLREGIDWDEWKAHGYRMIDAMWERCTRGIAFNFHTTYNNYTDEKIGYMDPAEAFDYCMRNFSRFVALDHAYPLFEGTIAVFREEFVRARFADDEFQRYYVRPD